MRDVVQRVLGLLVGLVRRRPLSEPRIDRQAAAQIGSTDQLEPGQAGFEPQTSHGDAPDLAGPTPNPPRRRAFGPRPGYRWGQGPGDLAHESRLRGPAPTIRPDRARPALSEDQLRRKNERDIRRFRQRRRGIEAEAAETVDPPESRLSREAEEAQAGLVREQMRRDAEVRAQERPYRRPLRNRTRIGPLRGVLKPRASLPERDRREDALVTAGFVAAAVIVGGLTRLNDGPVLVIVGAAFVAVLVAVLVLDYRRWYGSFPARFTRGGAVAGLAIFIGVTSIGRVGELAPVPLPSGCSTERVRAFAAEWYTTEQQERRTAGVEWLTAHLRRPGFLVDRVERAESHLSRGSRRVLLGDPEDALADYQRSLELDPTQVSVPVYKISLYRIAGCPEHAHEEIAKIRRNYVSSEDGVALRRAARSLLQFGYAQEALDVARRAAQWAPASPHEAEVIQGNALAQLGRLNEALGPLTASIEGFLLNEQASFFRALVYRRLGDRPSAWADIEHAIKRRPTWAAAHAAKGLMLVEEGQLGQGLESFAEAVRLADPKPQAYYWRGQVLMGLGMAELAREDFRQTIRYQAISYVASSADPWVGLAAAELALGNRQQAAQALAESRRRPVRWVDEPTVSAWLAELERELEAAPGS